MFLLYSEGSSYSKNSGKTFFSVVNNLHLFVVVWLSVHLPNNQVWGVGIGMQLANRTAKEILETPYFQKSYC